MSTDYHFTVLEEESGKRLDVVLSARVPHLSRTAAGALARAGEVRVNGKIARASSRVTAGDTVLAAQQVPASLHAAPEPIPLDIVYRDADLAVINKPAGLVVHPAAGHRQGTLANALTFAFPGTTDVGTAERPGIVHRLDRDTSGLIVVALNPQALASLQAQIASREVGRRYLALVVGEPHPVEATIDAPIGRDRNNRQKMATHGLAARPARSTYRFLERLPGFSLLEVKLHTGRTHQIRVHMAALGHPIAGDTVYGGPKIPGLERQFLHAYRLTLRSPSTGREMTFEAKLPPDLQHILTALRSGRVPSP